MNRKLKENKFEELANLYKIFGDVSRIKILYSLFEKELSVNEIASSINMTQSAVSHQLKILKLANLIKNRRDKNVIYYSLSDHHVLNIFDQGLEHINE